MLFPLSLSFSLVCATRSFYALWLLICSGGSTLLIVRWNSLVFWDRAWHFDGQSTFLFSVLFLSRFCYHSHGANLPSKVSRSVGFFYLSIRYYYYIFITFLLASYFLLTSIFWQGPRVFYPFLMWHGLLLARLLDYTIAITLKKSLHSAYKSSSSCNANYLFFPSFFPRFHSLFSSMFHFDKSTLQSTLLRVSSKFIGFFEIFR